MAPRRQRQCVNAEKIGRESVSHLSDDLSFGRVEIPTKAPELWGVLETEWAGDDPTKWRNLSMLYLFYACRWTIPMIARAHGIHKGNVSRAINRTREELRDKFVPMYDIDPPEETD